MVDADDALMLMLDVERSDGGSYHLFFYIIMTMKSIVQLKQPIECVER